MNRVIRLSAFFFLFVYQLFTFQQPVTFPGHISFCFQFDFVYISVVHFSVNCDSLSLILFIYQLSTFQLTVIH